jgi:cyclophilin family peptidyl-prolyl cis-trans isomerase
MNKQAIIFGMGGIITAVLIAFVVPKPGSSQPEQTNVLSESIEERDTMQEQEVMKKEPPAMQIDTSKSYRAILHTSTGDITIQFNDDQTPITVNNFISLARDGFYDGTMFHRVIDGFMIQGGDPEGTGAGGPGYQFDDESFEGDYTRGTIAMANSGPNTNGSQFFIMHQDHNLPHSYVIFGKVASGMDAVDAIATAEVATNFGGEQSKPVSPVTIESVEIIEE